MTETGMTITAEFVEDLLRDQHPDLADLPIALGAKGWDNQLWRLGENLAVRLPWASEGADELLLKEHTWLPVLAPRLPLPVPVPQRLGEPSERYPRSWIVTTWVPGAPADVAPIADGPSATEALAGFLTALHQPAPADAPIGRGRGGPLRDVADSCARAVTSLAELGLITDRERVGAILSDALAAPAWDGPAVWLHADLHPANVLTENGTICGVIDFGDLCAGDPACDLAAAWILLPDEDAICRFRETSALAADPGTWRRARGWAIWRAVGSLHVADAARRGEPGGKTTWGPPAAAALQRLCASDA